MGAHQVPEVDCRADAGKLLSGLHTQGRRSLGSSSPMFHLSQPSAGLRQIIPECVVAKMRAPLSVRQIRQLLLCPPAGAPVARGPSGASSRATSLGRSAFFRPRATGRPTPAVLCPPRRRLLAAPQPSTVTAVDIHVSPRIPCGSHFWPTGVSVREGYPGIAGIRTVPAERSRGRRGQTAGHLRVQRGKTSAAACAF